MIKSPLNIPDRSKNLNMGRPLETPGLQFCLDAEQINELCDAAERIFKDEPSVLRLRGELPPSSQCQWRARVVLPYSDCRSSRC